MSARSRPRPAAGGLSAVVPQTRSQLHRETNNNDKLTATCASRPGRGLAALPALAQGQLTVINFGGANGKAQQKAFFEPFAKASGTKVQPVEYNGEQAKIKAMVETKSVSWDVVEVESPDVARGCDEGLFERTRLGQGRQQGRLPAGAVQPCGVGIFVWSTVMAYDADKLKAGPKTWADFWDVQEVPRQARPAQGRASYNLEFALMADGVKPADVYKVLATKEGADRAFKKLTELKPTSSGGRPAHSRRSSWSPATSS